jgi:molybdate transport system substrate-binding protein
MVKLIASNAVKEALTDLVPRFEAASGYHVTTIWGGTLDISQRIRDGEVVDLVILSSERIDALIAEGRLNAGSRIDIARSGIGVAVPAGARRPDVSSAAALEASLLATRRVVLSSGPSSVYLADLFRQMGIAGAINVHQIGPGLSVAAALARREGDIGFTQVSELVGREGIDFVGPLPTDVQHLTIWSAGLHVAAPAGEAARMLTGFLTAPEAATAFRQCGMTSA